METAFEPHAHSAARLVQTDETHAFRSKSTIAASVSTAGTATGAAGDFSTKDGLEKWLFANRGISPGTLVALNAGLATEIFFPDLKRQAPGVVFKYAEGWKARAIPEKSFVAGKGFKLSFLNQARVIAALKAREVSEIFIVEGEMDACALVEAGVPANSVLSVPNGAKERPAEDQQKGHAYAQEALKAGLNLAKSIVWCGDNDGPGLTLRADMVAIFGAARFRFVEWPDGCKDANSVLLAKGGDALAEIVEKRSKPWPVSGLYRISALPEPAPLTLWDPGFQEWERKVMLAPRTLSVATGHPGHGKTQLWGQIWFQIARAYGVNVCCASFETRPKPHMRRQLRSLYSGQLEKHMTAKEIAEADAWIEAHYLFAVHPDHKPTLPWLLELAEVAVIRHGARIIQVDPWNRLESARADRESETDYIGRCLRELHSFAHDMNCHVQILAHPAKMDGARRGQAPNLEDISGSKNWDNAVDQGFVVHRPMMFDGANRRTDAILYHRKSRFEELGHPCKLMVDYSMDTGRYRSTDYEAGDLGPDAFKKTGRVAKPLYRERAA